MSEAPKAVPAWLAPYFSDGRIDRTVAATVELTWIGYTVGCSTITIDGDLTAAELRDLAAMIEANARDG